MTKNNKSVDMTEEEETEEEETIDLSGVPDTIWSDYETDEYRFWKEIPEGKVWNVDRKKNKEVGPIEITFDQKKIYDLWADYPDNMTKEEVEIFDKEQPFWADFFSDRKKKK